jgi:hypothetical protein
LCPYFKEEWEGKINRTMALPYSKDIVELLLHYVRSKSKVINASFEKAWSFLYMALSSEESYLYNNPEVDKIFYFKNTTQYTVVNFKEICCLIRSLEKNKAPKWHFKSISPLEHG